MKRFINADIVAGSISDAITLNRYAYANGNPVAFVDPFGLSSSGYGGVTVEDYHNALNILLDILGVSKELFDREFKWIIGDTLYYGSLEFKRGETILDDIGDISSNIKDLAQGQIELAASIDIFNGSLEFKTTDEIYMGFEYSVNIDEYNKLELSHDRYLNGKNVTELQLTTSYNDGSSLSTLIGKEVLPNRKVKLQEEMKIKRAEQIKPNYGRMLDDYLKKNPEVLVIGASAIILVAAAPSIPVIFSSLGSIASTAIPNVSDKIGNIVNVFSEPCPIMG